LRRDLPIWLYRSGATGGTLRPMTVSTVDRSEERLGWTLLAVLAVVLAYALAGAVGAAATAVLHWTGVALLVIGIGLAIAGIVRVRHDWTAREWAIQAAHRASETANGDVRPSPSYLVGSGTRLQVWGVACLLLGTIIAAIW